MTHSFENGDAEIVREVAARVEVSAARARTFGMALTGLAAFSMFVAAVAMVWIGINVHDLLQDRIANAQRIEQNEKRSAELVNNIMGCLVGQFSEHRAAVEAKPPPVPINPEAVARYCSAFFQLPPATTTTTTRP